MDRGQDKEPVLRFGGLVVVGKCKNCRMAIWGQEGEKKVVHSYCGITVPPEKPV
jgi:hypothetical protein